MNDINSGLYIAIGPQGSGKTLMMVKNLYDELEKNPARRVFANMRKLKCEHEYFNFKQFLDLVTIPDDSLNGSIFFIDEIHLYFDSLDFTKKDSRKAQVFFSQLRKRGILVLATTQYLMQLDIRIRRQATNVFDMEHIFKNLYQVTTNDIDGYLYRPISKFKITLDDYWDKYDTNEIITLD